MREIKMKVWVDNKRMIGPFDLSQNPTYWAHKLEDGERLLYTGLKDKNGVEIYEGDILNYTKRPDYTLMFEVVFDHSSFSRKWISEDTAKIRGLKIENLAYNTSTIFEVIGNIHQNPELLEANN